MTWMDIVESELLARYGEPRIRPGDEPARLRGERGWCRRWAWVWFPGGVNHHLAVDRYEGDLYEVRAGHHGSKSLPLFYTDISFWSQREPSASQVRAVLSLAGLLDPAELPDDMRISSAELAAIPGESS